MMINESDSDKTRRKIWNWDDDGWLKACGDDCLGLRDVEEVGDHQCTNLGCLSLCVFFQINVVFIETNLLEHIPVSVFKTVLQG